MRVVYQFPLLSLSMFKLTFGMKVFFLLVLGFPSSHRNRCGPKEEKTWTRDREKLLTTYSTGIIIMLSIIIDTWYCFIVAFMLYGPHPNLHENSVHKPQKQRYEWSTV